jgi:hypothetical protein
VNETKLAEMHKHATSITANLNSMTRSLTELEKAVEDFNKKLGDTK